MELKGRQQIAASVEQVWAGLFDPEVLQRCLPGCESVTRESEYAYTSKLALKIGPVSARFTGGVEMQDVQAPQRCKLVFQGAGGTAGFARGQALVQLTPRDGGTYLEYDANIHVGGKLAQIGARLIDTTSKKLAAQFFERFRAVFDPQERKQDVPSVQNQAQFDAATIGEPAVTNAAVSTSGVSASASLPSGGVSGVAGLSEPPSLATRFLRARVVWFVLGAVLSSAVYQDWLDERAGWFILGAVLAYLLTRIGKDEG